MRIHAILLLSVLALLACMTPARAAESYANCTGFITKLPTTISTPGTWCLKQNLSTAAIGGIAITINANDVVLDCNDFQIRGTPSATSASIGIKARNLLHDIVRHCKVQGFNYGLDFRGVGGGHVVEDNEFDGNAVTGILVQGDGSIVRRNRVFNTGPLPGHIADGIYTSLKVIVSDNTVSYVTSAGYFDAKGIATSSNLGGNVDHNRVRQVVSSASGCTTSCPGVAYHFYAGGTRGPMAITDNDVLGGEISPHPSVGLYCVTRSPIASRNIIAGSVGGSNCVDGGQNDLSF